MGMPEIRIHDLRHTFASYIVADGHTLYVAQQLLGHSDLRTTMRYAHFAQTTLLAAVGTLDQILERNEPLGKSGIAPEEEGAPRGADSATSHGSRQKHEKM